MPCREAVNRYISLNCGRRGLKPRLGYPKTRMFVKRGSSVSLKTAYLRLSVVAESGHAGKSGELTAQVVPAPAGAARKSERPSAQMSSGVQCTERTVVVYWAFGKKDPPAFDIELGGVVQVGSWCIWRHSSALGSKELPIRARAFSLLALMQPAAPTESGAARPGRRQMPERFRGHVAPLRCLTSPPRRPSEEPLRLLG